MRLADTADHEIAPFKIRPAADVTFALLEGRATLFSQSAQKLYALNPLAALIWCCFEERGDPQAARARLVDSGVDRADAAQYVDDAIGSWLRLGLLDADFRSSRRSGACGFSVEGLPHSIETPWPDVSRQIAALFDRNPTWVDDAGKSHFQVIARDGTLHVFFEGRRVGGCAPEELAPTIKALVAAGVLSRERRDIVFHAACLSHRDRTLLVSGPPGAGKTTLSLQLVARGFAYGGDDIALISPEGLAKGLPFAPAVKSGAWDIVGALRPELAKAPVHRRPDGKEVKYPELDNIDQEPHSVGWVAFLRRESGAAVQFVPLELVEAMRRVIEGAYSAGGKLSLAGFGTLRRMLAGARSFELTYGSSADAGDAISDLCNDSA